MNRDLLLKIAASIEADPNTYDPWQWCGTAYCLAGYASVQGGKTKGFIKKGEGAYGIEKWNELRTVRPDKDILRPARKLLDIPEWLAQRIFDVRWKPVPPLTVPQALRQWAETGDPRGCMIPAEMVMPQT